MRNARAEASHRRRTRSAALESSLLAALLLATSLPATASSIAIFADAEANDCELTVTASTQVTWYLFAMLYDDGAIAGITGAEFRQEGTPASFIVTAVQNPAANISLGNPLGTGTNIAFPACQGRFERAVLLYTVNGFATSVPSNLVFQIEAHTNPSNPLFRCPLLVLCDEPVFTTICVFAACMPVNQTRPTCCSVAVDSRHWSAVKALYSR